MYICARFSSGEMTNMKEAFFKLHLSVLLAGATGIFGRLISLNEGLLVWHRMLLAGLLFALLSAVRRRFPRIGWKEVFKIGGIGILLGLHWVFFYGNIKASNISIGVVCFSLVSFFTAFLEPWINRHRISVKEVLFSLLTLLGIALIFHLDTRYRQGILLGITSSVLAALFTITNKKVAAGHYPQDNDFYTQPGDLYRLLPADEKDRLTSNFTAATADVPEPIRIRAIARFYQADEHCGKEMARKTQTDLKKVLEEVKRQQALESR